MQHTRYMITTQSDAEGLRFRTSRGKWSGDVTRAKLWMDGNFAERKARQLRKKYIEDVAKYAQNMVIDQDEIEVIMVRPVEVMI